MQDSGNSSSGVNHEQRFAALEARIEDLENAKALMKSELDGIIEVVQKLEKGGHAGGQGSQPSTSGRGRGRPKGATKKAAARGPPTVKGWVIISENEDSSDENDSSDSDSNDPGSDYDPYSPPKSPKKKRRKSKGAPGRRDSTHSTRNATGSSPRKYYTESDEEWNHDKPARKKRKLSSSEKRGRGRPKKAASAYTVKVKKMSNGVSRGRGRPRKNPSEPRKVVEKPAGPKRGRGRPPKVKRQEESEDGEMTDEPKEEPSEDYSIENADHSEEENASEHDGEKSKPSELRKEVVEKPAGAKRGRGRPPKVKRQEEAEDGEMSNEPKEDPSEEYSIVENVDHSEENASEHDGEKGEKVSNGVSRGRGRPRKNPSEPKKVVSKPAGAKRGRGRPPKRKISEPQEEKYENTAEDDQIMGEHIENDRIEENVDHSEVVESVPTVEYVYLD